MSDIGDLMVNVNATPLVDELNRLTSDLKAWLQEREELHRALDEVQVLLATSRAQAQAHVRCLEQECAAFIKERNALKAELAAREKIIEIYEARLARLEAK